jgi:hypothetical protein
MRRRRRRRRRRKEEEEKRRRKRRRTRTFKTPVNFNPKARRSALENWTFVVKILRAVNAE